MNEKLQLNEVYEGTVKSIAHFGAFIEVLPGKQGLCHISEMSDKRVNNVRDIVNEGDSVKVKVIKIDDRNGKIGLSIKAV